jgi:hypothetical protein
VDYLSVLIQNLVCDVEPHGVVQPIRHSFALDNLVDMVQPEITFFLQLKDIVRLGKILGQDIIN